MLSTRLSVSAAVFLAAIVAPSFALADECSAESPCPKGFACEAVAGACPAIACAPDSKECADTCTPETVNVCVPTPCAKDSDCDANMVCHSQDALQCTGGTAVACPADVECDLITQPECKTVTMTSCVPKWTLPCQEASDCGEGFTCEAAEECTCSGSSGSAGSVEPAQGGATAAPSEGTATVDGVPEASQTGDSCTCRTLDTKYCKIVERTCDTEKPCQSGWTCSASAATRGTTSSSGGDDTATSEPAESVCMPPYFDVSVRSGTASGLDDAGMSSSEQLAPATSSNGSDKQNTDEDAPSGDGAPVAKGDAASANAESSDQDSGCQISARGLSAAQSRPWLSLLGVIGALGVVGGRRRRR